MKQEDEEFVNIKATFKSVYSLSGYTIKDENSKVSEIQTNFDKVKIMYDQAEKESNDPYCLAAKNFLEQTATDIALLKERIKTLEVKFAQAVEFYLIDKGDEKA